MHQRTVTLGFVFSINFIAQRTAQITVYSQYLSPIAVLQSCATSYSTLGVSTIYKT